MIAKIILGTGFTGVLKYVLEKKDAEVLGINMLLSDISNLSAKELGNEFGEHVEFFRKDLRSDFNKCVEHTSLSFSHKDKLSSSKMEEIGREFMNRRGYQDSQYIIVRHHDTIHDHVHIVSNRVDMYGKVISARNNHHQSNRITSELEDEYNLEKWSDCRIENNELSPKNKQESADKKIIREVLRNAITQARIRRMNSWGEFENYLKQSGIETRVIQRNNGNGISFRTNHVFISGTKLGFKYNMLSKYFGVNYQAEKEKEQLKNIIGECIAKSHDYSSFNDHLRVMDISLSCRFNKTGLYGTSYTYNNRKYKGSELGYDAEKLKQLDLAPSSSEYFSKASAEEVREYATKLVTEIKEINKGTYEEKDQKNSTDISSNMFFTGVGLYKRTSDEEDEEEKEKKKKRRKGMSM